MKQIFLDTNILLDLIDNEQPGHKAGLRLQALMVGRNLTGLLAWHSLSIIEYIGKKRFGATGIHELIKGLLHSFSIPKTATTEAKNAFNYLTGDLEDAMQIAAAITGNADFIITRDTTGFSRSPITITTPEQLVERLRD